MQTIWQDYVPDKFGRRDATPPNALAVPKSVFSNAVTVMDKVEGWNEEEWAGSKFAACMWVYTMAVLSDGKGPRKKPEAEALSTIMDSVSWVCEDALWEHEWVTELDVLLKENEILEALNYDLNVPCAIQRRLLWFSSPSRLIQRFANDGTKIAKYHEAVNMAIEITFTMPFEGLHTRLLRSFVVVLYMLLDKDWND